MPDASDLVHLLSERGWTIATAESLTAGLVSARIADVPGASAVLRGGVVAYDPEVKVEILGLDADLVCGAVVSERVSLGLARGVRHLLHADVGVGTTGVAGPQSHGGEPVGSVWIAVSTPQADLSRHLDLTGTRAQIREATVQACLDLAAACLLGNI